jgi:hypothetical protein
LAATPQYCSWQAKERRRDPINNFVNAEASSYF